MTDTNDDAPPPPTPVRRTPPARTGTGKAASTGGSKGASKGASKRAQRQAGASDAVPGAGPEDIYLTGEAERAIYNRLSRLEGQVRGVKKMLAERKSCDEMLVQISALKQAVNGVAAELLQAHMQTCVLGRVEIGDGERALASLRSALAKVMKHG